MVIHTRFLRKGDTVTVNDAILGLEYTIKDIELDDDELLEFLFSLGCYSGESITAVSRRKGTCVVSIKDARYSIDNRLADTIKLMPLR